MAVYLFVFLTIVTVIFDGAVVNVFIAEPLYGASALLFLFTFLLVLWIARKSTAIPPSAALFMFFLAGPIFGPPGLRVFEKLFGDLSNVNIALAFPLFVWALGMATLMVGILVAHFIFKGPKRNRLVLWDEQRASLLLWGIMALAAIFTVFVLFRLGYVPILHSNIDAVRGSFHKIVGEYPLKFSRLWLVAVPLAVTFAAVKTNRKVYLVLTAICCLLLMIYGQRIYAFVAIATAVLLSLKMQKVRIRHLATFGLGLVVLSLLYAEFRGGRSFKELSTSELVVMNIFREWREYTFVVNEVRESGDFYGEQFFTGALLPILPKQVWAVVGVDKNKLMTEKSAVYVLGRQFGDELGIRIGTIGEAYTSFGLFYGVCLQLFAFGLLFGWLEVAYLRLDKRDARLALVCFGLALLLFLPIATLIATLSTAVFFGFFLLMFHFAATYKLQLAPSHRHTTGGL